MRYRHCLFLVTALFFVLLPLTRAEDTANAATGATASTDVVKIIADLRGPLEHTFSGGSWQGKISTTQSGCAVHGSKGADGKGEVGQNLQPLLNLTEAKWIEVALGVAPKNEVPNVTIAFNDADGIQYTAGIRVDQLVPGNPVWLRVKLSDFKLNDWKGDKAGKRINWAKIASWHLQGDWRTEAPCHLIFIALRTRQ